MRFVDRRFLKIVFLTLILWISVQLIFLNYVDIFPNESGPGATFKEQVPQQGGQNFFGRILDKPVRWIEGGASLLARFGGGGSSALFGENGRAVRLTANLVADSKAKFSLNQFDVIVSDLISVNRTLLDVRHPSCRNQGHWEIAARSELNTSVVIVFHNEAWSTLLRTVHSVLNRSPKKLLHEIILVDDASDRDYLGGNLDTYVNELGASVRLIRLTQRAGLVRARLTGANMASGTTLTFLDAHCEVTEGWLEPLIAQVYLNPQTVVCPAIDVISDTTFAYLQSTEKTWGIFGWDLLFDWDVISPREEARRNHDPAAPIRTPAMAGGLFLIKRDYFYNLGAYDEGMEVWGGENVEMSLRVWQCGGQLLILPCSRVGHVFRKASPYTWPGGVTQVLHRNRIRTARVWLDEYLEFPLTLDPSLRSFNYGEIAKRIALRKRLNCKGFSWYLENIFPESNLRTHVTHLGQIRNSVHDVCFDTGDALKGHAIGTATCRSADSSGVRQTFSVSARGELTASRGCLSARQKRDSLIMSPCDGTADGLQIFSYDKETKHLIHDHSGLCIRINASKQGNPLYIDTCTDSNEFKWDLPPPFNNRTQ